MFIQQWAIDPGQCSKTRKIYESKSTRKEETKLSFSLCYDCKEKTNKLLELL